MRTLLLAAFAAIAVAFLAAPASARTVKVANDYFVRPSGTPTVTVTKGTRVTWKWAQRGLHNVVVARGPQKFRSSLKRSGSYSKRVRRAGTYRIVCSIHQPDMTMRLRVR